MYQRILVPLEREGGPEGHLRHAAALATRVGAEITLLRVITVVPSEDPFTKRVQVEAGSKGAREKAEAEEYVSRLADRLQEEGVNAKSAVIISEKAEDEAIVEYGTQSNSDLTVLPNQRRSLVSRWLQGSLTAKVQRRSRVPVLLVRDEEEGE
jgi:nucleotide-binding universal stress UspA family protein